MPPHCTGPNHVRPELLLLQFAAVELNRTNERAARTNEQQSKDSTAAAAANNNNNTHVIHIYTHAPQPVVWGRRLVSLSLSLAPAALARRLNHLPVVVVVGSSSSRRHSASCAQWNSARPPLIASLNAPARPVHTNQPASQPVAQVKQHNTYS